MAQRPRVIGGRILSQRFGALVEYTMRYCGLDGAEVEVVREVYDRGQGVAVLPYDPDADTIVLVRQFRPGALINGRHSFLIEAVAGIVEGVDIRESAEREVLEETGYALADLQLIGAPYCSPASFTEVVSLFLGTYKSGFKIARGGGLTEEGEDIEVMEMGFEDGCRLLSTGEIVDMKTIILLQHLRIARLENSLERRSRRPTL